MSIFAKLQEQNIGTNEEQLKDNSGVSFLSESGVYNMVIHRAWAIQSKEGAIGIHIEFNGAGLFSTDIYLTNKAGETFYTDKNSGKKNNLPGYLTAKKINYIATGEFATSLRDLKTENRIVKTKEWKEVDGERKQVEIEKEVEFLVNWKDKPIILALQEVEATDKEGKVVTTKDGVTITNLEIIDQFFENNLSASEAYKGETEPKQIENAKKRLENNPIRKAKGSKPTGGSASGSAPKPKPNPFA